MTPGPLLRWDRVPVYIDQLHLGQLRARRRSPGGPASATPAFIPPSVVGRRNG
jgi:hypothetical protein